MKSYKYVYFLLLFLNFGPLFSQDFSDDWEGYFSYLDIADSSQSNDYRKNSTNKVRAQFALYDYFKEKLNS